MVIMVHCHDEIEWSGTERKSNEASNSNNVVNIVGVGEQ
jgi:hypothetical protein